MFFHGKKRLALVILSFLWISLSGQASQDPCQTFLYHLTDYQKWALGEEPDMPAHQLRQIGMDFLRHLLGPDVNTEALIESFNHNLVRLNVSIDPRIIFEVVLLGHGKHFPATQQMLGDWLTKRDLSVSQFFSLFVGKHFFPEVYSLSMVKRMRWYGKAGYFYIFHITEGIFDDQPRYVLFHASPPNNPYMTHNIRRASLLYKFMRLNGLHTLMVDRAQNNLHYLTARGPTEFWPLPPVDEHLGLEHGLYPIKELENGMVYALNEINANNLLQLKDTVDKLKTIHPAAESYLTQFQLEASAISYFLLWDSSLPSETGKPGDWIVFSFAFDPLE